MIFVTWSPTHLTVTGHALHAPEGEDIVCAAASILALTMAASAGGGKHVLRPGYADIRFNGCTEALATVMTGFAVMEGLYPEYITVSPSLRAEKGPAHPDGQTEVSPTDNRQAL